MSRQKGDRGQEKRVKRSPRDEAPRELRGLLKAVSGATDIIMAAVDREFRYTFFNEAYAEEILRLTGKRIRLGTNMIGLFADQPEQQKVVRDEWSRPLAGETTEKILEFGVPGRHRRIYKTRHAPLRNGRGVVIGATEVANDITDRVRVDEALKDAAAKTKLLTEANEQLQSQAEELQAQHEELQTQEEELRSQTEELRSQADALRRLEEQAGELIRHAPTGIYEIDYRGPRFISVNDAMCRILGYSREELFAIGPARLLDDESRARFAERIRRQLAGEAIEEAVEYRVRRKDGEMIDALLHVSIQPTAGDPYRVLVVAHDITHRKRIEEELVLARAEAERRAREIEVLMDAVPAGVMISRDREGLQIYGNWAAHRLLRVPLGEDNISKSAPDPMKLRTYRPVKDGVEVPPEGLPIQRAARGEEVRDWDCDLVFDDGEVRHVIINATQITGEDGESRGAVGAFLDVTDLKRAERAQSRVRERYELLSVTAGRLLESQNPQAVIDELCRRVMEHLDCQVFFNFLVDKEAGRLHLNACAGIPEAEVRRLRWLDYGVAVCGFVAQNGVRVVAEDIQTRPDPRTDMVARFGVQAYACHPLMAGSEVLGTLSFGAKNRTHFAAEDVSLMKTVADQVSVAIEHMRDQRILRERGLELQRLTETLEHRVQERTAELAAANERLKTEVAERVRLVAAVEQAEEGVVIMDSEGRIRYANAAFERLSGRSRARLQSMRYDQLLSDREEDGDLWASVRATIDRSEAWRGRVTRKSGDGGAEELDVTVSPIRDAARSVTSYLALERDVTQEVRMQQHLRQMQKMEALGTLAGGIAHDFNNILNPIFINTELLLLDTSADLPSRRYLEITLKAAERGRDLVKQIISFSRQKEKERKPCKAGPVVKEAMKFLRVSLPATIEIRETIQPESGHILSDPAQIHQIVMNLCNNAAYAMREKGGVLEVSLGEVDLDAVAAARYPGIQPGSYLRLTVSDTGTGMSPEVVERAFDPFFTTKKTGEGSGMGLAVVNGIVRDHAGAVSVSSEVGSGSTFIILLPRVAYEIPHVERAPDALPRGSERILFIDDEEVQIQSVWSMLQRLGYEVVALADGAEALALFRFDPQAFDLVITDQTMPQITGTKIAEEILKVRPDVPVILCTGYSEIVDASEARALGIREFLMKPFSIREIAETLRRALSAVPGED